MNKGPGHFTGTGAMYDSPISCEVKPTNGYLTATIYSITIIVIYFYVKGITALFNNP